MRVEQTTARIAVEKGLSKQQPNWVAITARHEAENGQKRPDAANRTGRDCCLFLQALASPNFNSTNQGHAM